VNITRPLFVFLFVVNTLWSNNQPTQKWKRANDLYSKEMYTQAITEYLKIDSLGYSSSELFYNLGNSYFKTGLLGKAIVNYRRSLLINPDNEDAIHNLTLVNHQIKDKFKPAVEPFVDVILGTLTELLSIQGWAILSIVLAVLVLVSVALTKLGILSKTIYLPILFTLICLHILSLFLNTKSIQLTEKIYGVITTDHTWAMSAPKGKTKLYKIHDGTSFEVLEAFEGWVEIQLPNNSKGWILQSTFEPIDRQKSLN